MAGTPSFCTKRWVFSETLEKYTSRSGPPAAIRIHHILLVAPGPLGGQRSAPASALMRSGRKPDQWSPPATTTGACR